MRLRAERRGLAPVGGEGARGRHGGGEKGRARGRHHGSELRLILPRATDGRDLGETAAHATELWEREAAAGLRELGTIGFTGGMHVHVTWACQIFGHEDQSCRGHEDLQFLFWSSCYLTKFETFIFEILKNNKFEPKFETQNDFNIKSDEYQSCSTH